MKLPATGIDSDKGIFYMEKAPYDLLNQWVNQTQTGRALDLGAGNGEVALWLDKFGFDLDAVERDPDLFQGLLEATIETGIKCIHADVREYTFEPEAYSLITAFGLLHFLRPTNLWTVADQVVGSLVPGGLFLCEVFSTDDPGFEYHRVSGARMIEPNTFIDPSTKTPIHYFQPSELERIFAPLQVLEVEEYRRIDHDSEDGFRAGISFVGKKA